MSPAIIIIIILILILILILMLILLLLLLLIKIIIIIITYFNVITFRSFIVIWLLAIFLLAKTKCAKFLTLDLPVM